MSGIIVIPDGPQAEWAIATFLVPDLTAINDHVRWHKVRLTKWLYFLKKAIKKVAHEKSYIFIFGHFLVKKNDAMLQQCNSPEDFGGQRQVYIQ